ncbi:MAG: RDD family protein [Kofleriaceae bacterium]|nr:RDD family protein [Kofleriaceae bacterium]MCB9571653.1 RDD family protein [Kofleriaceae bacterium]
MDLGVIVPVALILTWVAARIGGIHLPASRTHGIDFWLDLLLASDPALVTWVAMTIGVAAVYLMVFQVTMAQTLGMRLLRMRIIDVWGDRPTVARCGARTAGYLASVATILLGFLWVGFDTEKRALHDWIAGTYVIKA